MENILKPKSREDINKIIDNYLYEFEKTHLPLNWIWRKGQKEAIQEIINIYLNKTYKTVICDIPVGGGKSIVGMAVSYILNESGKTGYILTSDISLQDQYEYDIKNFKLPWGSVKGIDNYICIDNMEKHSVGTCKIRNIIPRKMDCYNDCPYFSARDFAINSETSVLNYSYWLIMQNYVKNKNENKNESSGSIFSQRDYVICDEAHKIMDIVQNHYSPRITENTIEKLQNLSDFLKVYKIKDHDINVINIKNSIDMIQSTENQEILYNHLEIIMRNLFIIKGSGNILKDIIKERYPDKKPPKEWRKSVYIVDWIKDLHCKIEDYLEILNKTSIKNLIKNPVGDNEIVFNCLEENYLMEKHFHKHTGFTVLMSATFSDPKEYLRSIALKGAKYIKVENTFDFIKSPIYYYPQRKMSYKYLEQNKKWLFEKINEIIENHKGESGIIHSASYDLTSKIRENLTAENRKRVFVYEGTEEKRKILDIMKISKDKVIMGPSLTTGLDLKDDFARFAIVAKMPYLSLSDKFVKAKMQINPIWYQWKTSIELIQSFGRTIRNENDWCISYILDGCFGDLIHFNRSMFPQELLNRLKIIN